MLPCITKKFIQSAKADTFRIDSLHYKAQLMGVVVGSFADYLTRYLFLKCCYLFVAEILVFGFLYYLYCFVWFDFGLPVGNNQDSL